jgi:hypothetical protein
LLSELEEATEGFINEGSRNALVTSDKVWMLIMDSES